MVRKKKKTKSHSQIVRVPKGVSSSKRNFSIEEERLLYLALSRINLGDNVMDFSSEDSRTVSVQASDIMKMYGNGTHRYTQLRETCKGLNAKSGIEVYVDNHQWELLNVFSSFNYENGNLDIVFNADAMPRLQLMKLGYSKMILGDVYKVRSQYSVRILELMLELRNNKHMLDAEVLRKTFSVKELRSFFGLEKSDKYQRPYDFLMRCIKKPVEEINKKTGYQLSFKEIRKGRVLEAIEFELSIPAAKMAELEEREEPKREMNLFSDASLSTVVNALVNIGISSKEANTFVNQYGEDYCREKIEMLQNASNVQDSAAWLAAAIRNDYKVGTPLENNLNTTYAQDKNKKEIALEFFLSLGYNEFVAGTLVSAAAENRFTSTDNNLLEEKGLFDYQIRECYLKGDFSELIGKNTHNDGLTVTIVEESTDEVDDMKRSSLHINKDEDGKYQYKVVENHSFSDDDTIRIKLQRKLVEAIYGGPKLTFTDIKEAGRLNENLSDLAKGFGKELNDLIEK